MEIDFQTLLLDPLYAEFGVTAVFTPNGNDGEIVFTVIDMTVGIAVAADAIVIDSTQPAATVRYAEVCRSRSQSRSRSQQWPHHVQ